MTKKSALYKYEYKKLLWLYISFLIFFLLYAFYHTSSVEREVHDIITSSMNLDIYFQIIEPEIYFFFSIIVFILVYLQYNDGFNKLWHSLPFTNKDIIEVKIITGISTIFAFILGIAIIMLSGFYKYANVYKDNLALININPSIISVNIILFSLLSIFTVFAFMYLFTVFIYYYIGNCFSGICLSFLLLHIPLAVTAGFDVFAKIPVKLNFLFNIHYYSADNSSFDGFNILENSMASSEIYINQRLERFLTPALIFYFILALTALFITYKAATTPRWIEQSSPFTKKYSTLIFKLAFLIDFAMFGSMLGSNGMTSQIALGIAFALIGYGISALIIKRQKVSI